MTRSGKLALAATTTLTIATSTMAVPLARQSGAPVYAIENARIVVVNGATSAFVNIEGSACAAVLS